MRLKKDKSVQVSVWSNWYYTAHVKFYTSQHTLGTHGHPKELRDSETFGIEKGHGDLVVQWLNDTAKKDELKFEARKYGYEINTENFGGFEMFSWIGDVQHARKLILKAGKRFKIRTIEGGYKTKERTFTVKKTDYAMVRRGDKLIGHLQFEAPRFGSSQWVVKQEERR